MDERHLVHASALLRDTRTLQYKLKSLLSEAFFNNSRCSVGRRVEARLVMERLTEATETLAEAFGLPPYGDK